MVSIALVSSIQGLELDVSLHGSHLIGPSRRHLQLRRPTPHPLNTTRTDLTVLPLEGDHVPAHAMDVTWGERPEDETIVGVDAASRMGCVRSLAGTCSVGAGMPLAIDSTGFSTAVSNPTPVHQSDMGPVITKASKGQDCGCHQRRT